MRLRNLFESAKRWKKYRKCYKERESLGDSIFGICSAPAIKIPECLSCPYCIINIVTTDKRERYMKEFLASRNSNSRGNRAKEITFL